MNNSNGIEKTNDKCHSKDGNLEILWFQLAERAAHAEFFTMWRMF